MQGKGSQLIEKRCFGVALWFMLVTFVVGVVLRMQFVYPIGGFPFSYVVHAHSHIGFLGWVFNGFFALAFKLFILEEDRAWFWRLFWVCQVGVLGMLVAFPIQGYALWSIVFSTLHLVGSIVFVIRLMRRNRAGPVAGLALKVGCWFLLVSSVGPFAMGPIMVTDLKDTIWKDLGIYYYLHFQYNGWFVFFLIAAALEQWGSRVSAVLVGRLGRTLWLLAVGVVLTYAQSALWLDGMVWISWVAGIGGVIQVYAVIRLLGEFRGLGRLFENSWAEGLGRCVAALFLLKVLLQVVAVFPGVSALGAQHFVVIAFLHLVFLGVVTPMLWAWGLELGYLRSGALFKLGVMLFAAGAVVSELALVYLPLSGFMNWNLLPQMFPVVFYASILILLGGCFVAIGRTLWGNN